MERPSTTSSLVSVEIETTLGAIYVFPDMPRKEMDALMRGLALIRATSSLTLVNVSGAALVLPWPIVKTIRLDKELGWTNLHV